VTGAAQDQKAEKCGDRGAGGKDGANDLGGDGQRTRLPTGLQERQAECVNADGVMGEGPDLSTNQSKGYGQSL